jgi:hypothetical protein
VLSDDPHAAGEALALFTSDTIACLDHLREKPRAAVRGILVFHQSSDTVTQRRCMAA